MAHHGDENSGRTRMMMQTRELRRAIAATRLEAREMRVDLVTLLIARGVLTRADLAAWDIADTRAFMEQHRDELSDRHFS